MASESEARECFYEQFVLSLKVSQWHVGHES